jgi:hypothetical protein
VDRAKRGRQIGRSEAGEPAEAHDDRIEATVAHLGASAHVDATCERGGPRRIELARVIYRLAPEDAAPSTSAPTGAPGAAKRRTAPLPKELVRRGLLAPALAALILSEKRVKGVPFYRLEESLRYQGAAVDRSTMCRYAEELGAAMGFIVLAARDESLARSFCLSTDATGVALQPRPLPEGEARKKQGCHKGHFFVTLADRDPVFFEWARIVTGASPRVVARHAGGPLRGAHTVGS